MARIVVHQVRNISAFCVIDCNLWSQRTFVLQHERGRWAGTSFDGIPNPCARLFSNKATRLLRFRWCTARTPGPRSKRQCGSVFAGMPSAGRGSFRLMPQPHWPPLALALRAKSLGMRNQHHRDDPGSLARAGKGLACWGVGIR